MQIGCFMCFMICTEYVYMSDTHAILAFWVTFHLLHKKVRPIGLLLNTPELNRACVTVDIVHGPIAYRPYMCTECLI